MKPLEAVLGTLAPAKNTPAQKTPAPKSSGKNARTLLFLTACLTAGCLMLALISQTGCSGGRLGSSAATEPAKAAVVGFLEAIQRGDEEAASGMLTKVARAKTQEMGLSVAPPVVSWIAGTPLSSRLNSPPCSTLSLHIERAS